MGRVTEFCSNSHLGCTDQFHTDEPIWGTPERYLRIEAPGYVHRVVDNACWRCHGEDMENGEKKVEHGMGRSTFSELLKEVRACRICEEYLPLEPRPVLRAASSARLLIVGQAPGRRVHETGIPFNDPSGDRLREWLGLDRASFYDESRVAIVPMGFCYPGTGSSGDLPPRTECAAAWRARLLACLSNIELTLAIGQYAIRWHIGDCAKRTLTETVQSWKKYWPSLVPMPHPSPRNNLWLRRNPWFENEIVPDIRDRVQGLLR